MFTVIPRISFSLILVLFRRVVRKNKEDKCNDGRGSSYHTLILKVLLLPSVKGIGLDLFPCFAKHINEGEKLELEMREVRKDRGSPGTASVHSNPLLITGNYGINPSVIQGRPHALQQ